MIRRFATLLLLSLVCTVLTAAAEEDAADAEAEAKPAAKYFKLNPDFIVNLKAAGSRPHFMSVTAQVMGLGDEPVSAVQHHLPAVRHELLMLFSAQEFDTMQTLEGKQKLLADALTAVNKVLEKEQAKTAVEAVYFTSLVIQ